MRHALARWCRSLVLLSAPLALAAGLGAAVGDDVVELFATADVRWRGAVAKEPPDLAALRQARADLTGLLRRFDPLPEQDPVPEVWRLIRLSLGDSWWGHAAETNWGAAWFHYSAYLEAESRAWDVPRAREAYLRLVRRLSGPPPVDAEGLRAHPPLPLEVLQEALRLADSAEDRARFHLKIALTWRERARTPAEMIRVTAAFEAAMGVATGTAWEPASIYAAALWRLQAGRVEEDRGEGLRFAADPAAAVRLLDLLEAHAGTHAELVHSARELRAQWSQPRLVLHVPERVEPGDPINPRIEVANISAVTVQALPVIPTAASLPLTGALIESAALAPLPGVEPIERTLTPPETPQHTVWTLGVPDWPVLAPGAWLVTVRAGDLAEQRLVMISDLDARAWETPDQLLIWVTRQGSTSVPVADAVVRIADAAGQMRELRTGADGLAPLPRQGLGSGPFRVVVEHGAQVATTISTLLEGPPGIADSGERGISTRLRVRAGEELAWIVAKSDLALATRAGATPQWQLRDRMGGEVARGEFTADAEPWMLATWQVPPTLPPGAVAWHRHDDPIPAAWFAVDPTRSELPTWTVEIEEITRDDALAERRWQVTVRWLSGRDDPPPRRATVWIFRPPGGPPLPALSMETSATPSLHTAGELFWSGTVELDRSGTGSARVDLPPLSTEVPLVVEASVPAERGRVWVARRSTWIAPTGHTVRLRADAALQRAGQPARITLQARDRDGRAVAVRGRLRLEHQSWQERWADRDGRVVTGSPPAAERRPWWAIGGRSDAGWHPVEPLTRTEWIAEEECVTDRNGEAVWETPPLPPGRHRLQWTSYDFGGAPVTAELELWSVPADATDLPFLAPHQLVSGGTPSELALLVIGNQVRDMTLLAIRDGRQRIQWQLVRAESGSHLIRLPRPPAPAWVYGIAPHESKARVLAAIPGTTSAGLTGRVERESGDPHMGTVKVILTGPAAAPGTSLAWSVRAHGHQPVPEMPAQVIDWEPASTEWQSPALALAPGHWSVLAVRMEADGRRTRIELPLVVTAPPRTEWMAPPWAHPGDQVTVGLRIEARPSGDTLPLPHLEVRLVDQALLTARQETLQDGAHTVFRWQVSIPPALPASPAVLRLSTTLEGVPASSMEIRPAGRPAWAAVAGRARDGDTWTVFPPAQASSGRLQIRLARDLGEVAREAAFALAEEPATDPIHLALQAVSPERLLGQPALPTASARRSPAQAASLLGALQLASGGWAPWQEGPADAATTAAVLFFLRQGGNPITESVRLPAQTWLTEALVQSAVSASAQAWMLAALVAPAPGPRAPFADPVIVEAYLQLVQQADLLPPGARAALAVAAAGLGFDDDARLLLVRFPAPGWFEEPTSDARWLRPVGLTPVGWPSAPSVEEDPALANAMILFAVSMIGEPRPLGYRALESLQARIEGVDWGSPTATGLALIALTHWRETSPSPSSARGRWILEHSEGALNLQLGGNTVATQGERFASLPWATPYAPFNLTWRRLSGSGDPPFSVVAQWQLDHPQERPRRDGLALSRTLERHFLQPTLLRGPRQRREPVPAHGRVQSGDVIEATYVLDLPTGQPAIVLTEHLPAGFQLATPSQDRHPPAMELRATADSTSADDPERFTGRQRPALYAPSLGPAAWVLEDVPPGRWEFRSHWQAAYTGSFVLPAAELAPLNDLPRPARSESGSIHVDP